MPPKKKPTKKKADKAEEKGHDVEIYVLQKKVEALQHRIALKEMSMLGLNAKVENMQASLTDSIK